MLLLQKDSTLGYSVKFVFETLTQVPWMVHLDLITLRNVHHVQKDSTLGFIVHFVFETLTQVPWMVHLDLLSL